MNPQQAQGDIWSSFIFLGMIMLVAYFMFIRPQSKRAKEHAELLGSLKEGDEVTTTAGIMGRIKKLHQEEGFIELAIAKETIICIQRNAIMTMLPKGSMKQF